MPYGSNPSQNRGFTRCASFYSCGDCHGAEEYGRQVEILRHDVTAVDSDTVYSSLTGASSVLAPLEHGSSLYFIE